MLLGISVEVAEGEPRLGRWETARKAKNAVLLFPLLAAAAASESDAGGESDDS